MTTISLSWTLDDKPIELELEVSAPDPDVGAFGWGIDSLRAFNEDNLEIVLSEAEQEALESDEKLSAKIAEHCESRGKDGRG